MRLLEVFPRCTFLIIEVSLVKIKASLKSRKRAEYGHRRQNYRKYTHDMSTQIQEIRMIDESNIDAKDMLEDVKVSFLRISKKNILIFFLRNICTLLTY